MMRHVSKPGMLVVLAQIVFAQFLCVQILGAQVLFPVNNATSVNPDVQLRLTFEEKPVIGNRGTIRVFDATDDRLIDELDMSIPAGPTANATGTALTAPYISSPYPYDRLPKGRTNADTKPGTPTAGAEPPAPGFQLTIIGGFTDGFHFYPVIVDGDTAIIQLHHNLLQYGKTYYVEMDSTVLQQPGLRSPGIRGKQAWRFRTKSPSQAPRADATELLVSTDGSGDFNTVQGAMDFVPDHSARRITVQVKGGIYHEIVYFRNKDNVTIRGETPGQVRVTYANSEVLNPHPVNLKTNEYPGTFPSRRAAFTADNSNGIHLVNLILETTVYGQAEGLLITGSRNILSHVHVIGSGDALQVNGPTYIVDSELTGSGDSILGRGPAFFERCTIRSQGVFMWIRNTEANHGNVFKDCQFIGTSQQPTTLARSPKNNGSSYPFAEAVLLNCVLTNISPKGWDSADVGGNVHFWEYNSRNPDRTAVDVSQRVSWSRQLDPKADTELIRDYSDPSYVLGGWNPALDAGDI
jgi:pectin methylesterase-like acyl-CoA thioesterase